MLQQLWRVAGGKGGDAGFLGYVFFWVEVFDPIDIRLFCP